MQSCLFLSLLRYLRRKMRKGFCLLNVHPPGKKPQGTGCFPCLRANEQRRNFFGFEARQSLCACRRKGRRVLGGDRKPSQPPASGPRKAVQHMLSW